jgi:hypothetical protein
MDPLSLAVLGGLNLGMGALKSQQAAKQRKQEAALRAAEIEASPWTGKAPSTQVSTATPNVWAEMAGAGINTLGQAAALNQAGLFNAGKAASVPTDISISSTESLPATLMPSAKQDSLWGNLANLSKMRA